jgi:regulator of protease activity HflC (stomatin/prohibitin superfamily)
MHDAIVLLLLCSVAAFFAGFRPPFRPGRLFLGVVLGFFVSSMFERVWVEVPVGSVGVPFDPLAGGIQQRELKPGWHLLKPWQTMQLFTTHTQAYNLVGKRDEAGTNEDSMACQTSEGLRILVDVTVLFHIDPDGAAQLWRSVGADYGSTIVRPSVRNVARSVVSRYSIMEVYSNADKASSEPAGGVISFRGRRQQVEDEMDKDLTPMLAAKGISLERVLLRSVHYDSADFEKAIVAKQVAQQTVLTQNYRLKIAQIQAESKVELAKGQAEAIRLRGQALHNQQGVVGLEFVQKLPSQVDVRILPSGAILMVNPGEGSPAVTPSRPKSDADGSR